jgi:tRNA wybutosine-synthesizing protein 1
VCYKEQFYGIKSHRCLQMTPALFWCAFRCSFCWRNIESTIGTSMEGLQIDPPSEIVDESIKAQRMLLSGFPGHENLDSRKFKEALSPNQVAISLAGEPTLYPKISELIKEYKGRGFTVFLVTDGMFPEVLEGIEQPTQLYISLAAADEEMQKKINVPLVKEPWKRLNESLEAMPGMKARTAIRLTSIKGMNMSEEKKFAGLVEKASPDFLEVKGYMYIGYSRQRLKQENMPLHAEVKEFAERINKHLNYNFTDESRQSRVVLLSRKSKPLKIGG